MPHMSTSVKSGTITGSDTTDNYLGFDVDIEVLSSRIYHVNFESFEGEVR